MLIHRLTLVSVLALGLVGGTLSTTAAEQASAASGGVSVVVAEFQNQTFFDSDVLGRAASTMLETELVQSRACRLLDSGELSSMPGTGVQIEAGRGIGAEYVVVGRVVRFRVTSIGAKTSVTQASGLLSGIGGGVGTRDVKAEVTIAAECVRVSDGTVICTMEREGVEESSKVSVGVVYKTLFAALETGIEGFDETLAGKATRTAVREIVSEMVAHADFSR